jgi:hypothetical protein
MQTPTYLPDLFDDSIRRRVQTTGHTYVDNGVNECRACGYPERAGVHQQDPGLTFIADAQINFAIVVAEAETDPLVMAYGPGGGL